MLNRVKKHYHWIVAVLVFLEVLVCGGLVNSFSIYVQPVSLSLGVSTTDYSVALIPSTIAGFVTSLFSGYLFVRFGYKKTTILSLLLLSLSTVLTAYADSIQSFCVYRVLYGMSFTICYTAGYVRIIKDWFWKHQGLILGAVSMSTGLGGSLMTILLTVVIEKGGWRLAMLVTAALVLGIAAVYFLLKDRPEQMGLKSYGLGEPMKYAQRADAKSNEWPGYCMKDQFKHPMIYLMSIAVLVSCVCIYTLSGFMIPHFRSVGFSAGEAAAYQSVYMLALAGSKLVLGYLHDRFGARWAMTFCMVCAIAGQFLLGSTSSVVLSYVGVVIFAAGLCMSSIMVPLMVTPLFGYRATSGVNGVLLGFSGLASVLSAPLSSMCYDTYGVYGPVFRICALVNVGVLVLFLCLFHYSEKQRKEDDKKKRKKTASKAAVQEIGLKTEE